MLVAVTGSYPSRRDGENVLKAARPIPERACMQSDGFIRSIVRGSVGVSALSNVSTLSSAKFRTQIYLSCALVYPSSLRAMINRLI
jgi:hypothetical protein